jgi:hypothetical protein
MTTAVAARILAGAFACLLSVTAAMAEPSPPSTLRDAFFGRPGERALPPVARYESEDGDEFILDRAGGKPVFMRFEGSTEIWALTPNSAPRGDIIYKNDMGEPVLRLTRLGGLTLFTEERPQGMAAGFAGPAPPLKLPSVDTMSVLLRDFAQASARASRAAQKLIAFEAEEAPLNAAALLADAAFVTSEAFVQLANQGDNGRRLITRFNKVEFAAGKNPGANARGKVVTITITPDRGLAGRPSSHRIAAAISRR